MKPEIKALKFTVPHGDIYYISWIIDAAEGIGFLQTDDSKAGKITVFTPVGQEQYLLSLMESLRAEGIPITENTEDEETGELEE